jgi:deoxyribose-phosphate aldolase
MHVRPEELAKTIDSQLPPEGRAGDLARLCEDASRFHFAAVCVAPGDVRGAGESLRGSDVKVSAAVGEGGGDVARSCVAAGAAELEVRLDADAMVTGDFCGARARLAAVVQAVRTASVTAGRGHVLVKAVIHGDRLDAARKQLACRIVETVDADFAVLWTAAPAQSSALWDVELLRDRLPERIGVKVSGPVAGAEEALALTRAGATRVGTPYAAALVGGLPVLRPAT